jgi:hypothetical protein
MAQVEIDITGNSEPPMARRGQLVAGRNPKDFDIDSLKYIPSIITSDSYAALSTANVEFFRQKFRE